jgi:hypothetical protein
MNEREAAHTCHAAMCGAHVPPRMHMCKRHWSMVPKALRDGLWDAYRPGQERRMDPSPDYLLAAARCVYAVAVKDNLPAEVIEGEVELYEAWSNMLTDDERDFMSLIRADEAAGMA